MNKHRELKPCECGGDVNLIEHERGFIICYYVKCDCGWKSPEFKTPEKAITSWNDHSTPSVDDVLEKLTTMIEDEYVYGGNVCCHVDDIKDLITQIKSEGE